ncbi:MAG: hypothetical protein IKO20_04575 [Bacteroidaceae bacterium]|nr:hypothetical protein [Bacteroidaceae bacterium]
MEQLYHDAIKKIVQFAKQNREFDKELREALGVESTSSEMVDSSNVQRIEKYLGLDYYIDDQPSLIDFSFIEEKGIRNQLISDNREMMRYRYGTRFHAINFGEYCRYAHLQIEMLLNYFYKKTNNGDLTKIKEHIKKHNTLAKLDNAKSIVAINYSVKLWAFCEEFQLKKIILENICKVRNEISHRSPQEDENKMIEYRKQLINMNLPLNNKGYVNTSLLKEESQEYKNKVKGKDWYKDYCFILWLKLEPYDEVKDAIDEVCSIIKDHFKKM